MKEIKPPDEPTAKMNSNKAKKECGNILLVPPK
jgi:hypothetical protein